MNAIKAIAESLLIVLALISLYPVKFKKKQVLWIMLIPALSIPTFLVFFAARIHPTPHHLAFALSGLAITLITTVARWLLVWYIRFQKSTYTYGDTPIIRERKVQVASSLLALSAGIFILTRFW